MAEFFRQERVSAAIRSGLDRAINPEVEERRGIDEQVRIIDRIRSGQRLRAQVERRGRRLADWFMRDRFAIRRTLEYDSDSGYESD